jgi:hypothetical protein
MLRLRMMAEILEPRARELLYYVKESLRQGGVVDALGAGCVLTGGGAMLPGMLDVTESQLRVPARTGDAGAPLAYARRAGSSRLFHGHRHASVCPPHRMNPRGGEQQFALQAARHLCSQFLQEPFVAESGGRSPNGTAEE